MRTRGTLFAASLFLVLTPALGFAQNKCLAGKIKAAVKKVACKGGLTAKQAAKGTAPDPDKVAKCESAFSKQFAKLEGKGGCTTTGDAATIEAKVDAFLLDLNTELFACPNSCLNGGTLNPDCSCTCPSGYESLNGGCFRIATDLSFDCGSSGCNAVAGSVDGSGNFLCVFRSGGPACTATNQCPSGNACQVIVDECLTQCTSP
jgi:hypothetical protein